MNDKDKEIKVGDSGTVKGIKCSVVSIEGKNVKVRFFSSKKVGISALYDWVAREEFIKDNKVLLRAVPDKPVDTVTLAKEMLVNTIKDETKITKKNKYDVEEHYRKARMQPLEFMQRVLTQEQFIGFLVGNAIKYLSRAEHKGQKKDDLFKAMRYSWWLKLAKEGKVIDPVKDVPPDDWNGRIF